MSELLNYGLIRTSFSQVIPDLSIDPSDYDLVEEVLRGTKRLSLLWITLFNRIM